MSDEHHHHHHDHDAPAPETQDAGSQALAEALRGSFAIVKIVLVLMVAAFFCSGFFTVGPSEKAVILRFGRLVGEGPKALIPSGKLHWSWPYPIDEVVKIPIAEIQQVKSTSGWYFMTPEQQLTGETPYAGRTLNPAVDGYALTADTNIVHVSVTLYYRIDDPLRAVFGFSGGTNLDYGLTGVSNAVQNVLNNALLYTAAHFKVDDILLTHVGDFHDAVLQRVTDLTDEEKLGIAIDHCEVQSVAPRQLQDIFAQVTTARQNYSRALLEANNYANTNLLAAGARAVAITNEAEIARNRYVEVLNADAKKFSNLLPKYESNPTLFAQVMLEQTMQQVLTNVQDKMYLPERADGKPRELRLMLNREPPQQKPAAANP